MDRPLCTVWSLHTGNSSILSSSGSYKDIVVSSALGREGDNTLTSCYAVDFDGEFQ